MRQNSRSSSASEPFLPILYLQPCVYPFLLMSVPVEPNHPSAKCRWAPLLLGSLSYTLPLYSDYNSFIYQMLVIVSCLAGPSAMCLFSRFIVLWPEIDAQRKNMVELGVYLFCVYSLNDKCLALTVIIGLDTSYLLTHMCVCSNKPMHIHASFT
jgi:hypothetical protein